jgi:DNA-binding phage protein
MGEGLVKRPRRVLAGLRCSFAKVSRESLYRMMSETGNPTYDSLKGILSGFR